MFSEDLFFLLHGDYFFSPLKPPATLFCIPISFTHNATLTIQSIKTISHILGWEMKDRSKTQRPWLVQPFTYGIYGSMVLKMDCLYTKEVKNDAALLCKMPAPLLVKQTKCCQWSSPQLAHKWDSFVNLLNECSLHNFIVTPNFLISLVHARQVNPYACNMANSA